MWEVGNEAGECPGLGGRTRRSPRQIRRFGPEAPSLTICVAVFVVVIPAVVYKTNVGIEEEGRGRGRGAGAAGVVE